MKKRQLEKKNEVGEVKKNGTSDEKKNDHTNEKNDKVLCVSNRLPCSR